MEINDVDVTEAPVAPKTVALVPQKMHWQEALKATQPVWAVHRNDLPAPNGIAMAAGLVAGVAGYFLWKKHPILGGIVGFNAGQGAMSLVQGDAPVKVVPSMASTMAGVVGALAWKDHPVLGFIAADYAGSVVANTTTSFVKKVKGI